MDIESQDQKRVFHYNQLLELLQGRSSLRDNHDNTNDIFCNQNLDNPNRNGTPTDVYTTTQMQEGWYNHVVDEDIPYRHLKNYFIYKKSDKTKKRISLPIDHPQSGLVIAGWLQPPPESEDLKPVFVVLENITEGARVTYSTSQRGYWILINSAPKQKKTDPPDIKNSYVAWYYLHEPCDHSPSKTIQSQAKVQWNMTVILTCISVLYDLVLFTHPECTNHSISKIFGNTSLLQQVSGGSNQSDNSTKLSEFELGIIASNKKVIKTLMTGCMDECTPNCVLLKSIDKLVKPNPPPNAKAIQIWVQLICLQLNQFMWGGMSPTNSYIPYHDHQSLTSATIDTKSAIAKKRNNFSDDAEDIGDERNAKKQKVDLRSDADEFDILALKERLKSSPRIPHLTCSIPTDNWDRTTTWESIVAENQAGMTLNGGNFEAKAFYNHIMSSTDGKSNEMDLMVESDLVTMEDMILAVYALRNCTSPEYCKLLTNHKNSRDERPITIIFNTIMRRTLDAIAQRIDNTLPIEKTTAMYLLSEILLLMESRKNINTEKNLVSIKKVATVDLKLCLDKVQNCIDTMNKNGLMIPCYLQSSFASAKDKLKRITDQSVETNHSNESKLSSRPTPSETIVKKTDEKQVLAKVVTMQVNAKVPKSVVEKPDEKQVSAKVVPLQVNAKIPKKNLKSNCDPTEGGSEKKNIFMSKFRSILSKVTPAVQAPQTAVASHQESSYGGSSAQKANHIVYSTGSEPYNPYSSTSTNYKSPLAQPYAPPVQQEYLWESKNMCGWGDVQEIAGRAMESSSNLRTFPRMTESIDSLSGRGRGMMKNAE